MEEGSLIGSAPRRKGLADITNLQQQPVSLRSKDIIDKLQHENMMLMKVLADRNKVIELSGIELKKLRINLEKYQQQNKLLSQTNSQMLAELNSGKDRLKALQHEVGCKNAVLKALKVEVGRKKFAEAGESLKEEDGEDKPCNMSRCGKDGESFKEEDGENKPCNTSRRRQSKSLRPSNTKPVQSLEGVDNKGVCLRRQSARFKAREPESNEALFEVDDKKVLALSCDDKVHEVGPSHVKPVQAKEGVGSKRVCLRRQSARFKAQEPESNEDLFEVDDKKVLASSCDDKVHDVGPSNVKPVQAKEGVGSKRVCSKRQSGKFKAKEAEMTEDVFEVDDIRYSANSSCDEVHNSGPISSGSSVKSNQEGSMSSGNEAQELRRTSVGRPLRRAAEKVQSYKERKVNVKLRREE